MPYVSSGSIYNDLYILESWVVQHMCYCGQARHAQLARINVGIEVEGLSNNATAVRHFVLPHSCLQIKMAPVMNITLTGRLRHEACPDTYTSHCRHFLRRVLTSMVRFMASASVGVW